MDKFERAIGNSLSKNKNINNSNCMDSVFLKNHGLTPT